MPAYITALKPKKKKAPQYWQGEPKTPGYGYGPGPPIPSAPTSPAPSDPSAPGTPPAPGGPSAYDSWKNDPFYQQALLDQKNALSQLVQQGELARRNAIIRFGDPNLAASLGLTLSGQDAEAARQNYASGNATLARIDMGHKQKLAAIINQLAGHGMLFSGDTGYLRGQENSAYGNTVYDARQTLADFFAKLAQDEADRRNALNSSVNSAAQQAWQNAVNNPAAYPAPPG